MSPGVIPEGRFGFVHGVGVYDSRLEESFVITDAEPDMQRPKAAHLFGSVFERYGEGQQFSQRVNLAGVLELILEPDRLAVLIKLELGIYEPLVIHDVA